MKFALGSMNVNKKNALERVLGIYDEFKGSEVIPVEVPSRVRSQPISLEETYRGALARAVDAYNLAEYDLGVGIESGLIKVTSKDYFQTTFCSIWNDSGNHIGMSSGYSHPNFILRHVLDGGNTIEEAYKIAGYTDSDTLGSEEGAIGILSSGRISRSDMITQAVDMAFMSLRNSI